MGSKKRPRINYDPDTGAYTDCCISRGFPLGGLGAGGFNIGSDGRFMEFRINNNWMAPIRGVRGTFLAVYADDGTRKSSRILRRTAPEREYENIRPVAHTRFVGELPGCEILFEDDLPIHVRLKGFTPHTPHNVKDATIPGTLLTLEMTNPGPSAISVSTLFSWENILGLGGTGFSGFKLLGKYPIGFKRRLKYREVDGNFQQVEEDSPYPTIVFRTHLYPDPHSHRYSTVGEYRLSVEPPDGFDVSMCSGWNAEQDRPEMLSEFAATGRLSSPKTPVTGSKGCRPAAAIAISGSLPPGETTEVVFSVVWWLPDHVTEKDAPKKLKSGKHDGKRVGHVYENFFSSSEEITRYLFKEKTRLYEESMALSRILDESTLPFWLKRILKNAVVSAICNTVIPKDGTLYTIEGTDWFWPYGGLTGTNDQRLSAHPYTATFFTRLDMREVDAFRRLMAENGSIPHGNGNCDFSLGDADVPYGWPVEVKFIMPAQNWTDLTMSEIIQAGKLYRLTDDREWLERFWPDMKRMAAYLDSISVHGVPEGGTTYDVWDFPGTFIYSATVYLATLATMKDLALEMEEESFDLYGKRFDTCLERIHDVLWQEEDGFFRSVPGKDSLFTASLAGDWVSRYAGLGPVIETDKALRHMERQYQVLIKRAVEKANEAGRRPVPWAEATSGGTKIKPKSIAALAPMEMIYVWQVLSYQAMEHIYLGQVDMGLDVIEMIYDRIYQKGYAWSAGLMGNNDSIYMTNTVIWAVLNAISGAALDVPRGVLTLSPQALPGQELTKVPVCFPGFWGMMTYHADDETLVLEVTKHFGKPVSIKTVRLQNREFALDSPLVLAEGAVWRGSLKGTPG
jgi:uncharacterized protein (DUF608 family)